MLTRVTAYKELQITCLIMDIKIQTVAGGHTIQSETSCKTRLISVSLKAVKPVLRICRNYKLYQKHFLIKHKISGVNGQQQPPTCREFQSICEAIRFCPEMCFVVIAVQDFILQQQTSNIPNRTEPL